MHKRQFFALTAAAALGPGVTSTAAAASGPGPVLLTVSGDVHKSNRGATNAALDQMMVKHGVQFERAWTFTAAALYQLPTVGMRPTLEYDAQPHRLHGPLLTTVLRHVGVQAAEGRVLTLRAVDGYTVKLALAEAQRMGMIVATHIDGAPLALGGLGPLWAVFDADRVPPFKDQPLKERFAQCPWGLYHVGVGAS